MAIIEDYDAISRRLKELLTTSPKGVNEITDLERWRDLARETAREYVENRRREAVTGQRRAAGRSFAPGRVAPTAKAQELSARTRLHSKPICDGKGTKSFVAGCSRAR